MSIKVAKFGGSSVANAEQIRKVKQIVEADTERRYVVPSAPGKRHKDDQKITDMLYLCHAHAQQSLPFDDVFDRIANRYLEIVSDLGLSLDMQPYLDEVKQNIADGASADYTASRGEFLNGPIIAAVLGYDFVDAADLIVFDSRGRFDSDTTQERMSAKLANHDRAVIPGFYGSMPNGDIKTFSRGGSDITGAIVARGVNAALYENWTDVSGLLMTDPRIVDSPKPISMITYRELRELAYMGASVLHDEAVFPVRQAGIPVQILNTNRPDDPGTRIFRGDVKSAASPVGTITGLAGRKDFTVILIEKALMNSEVGFGRRVLNVLEVNGVSFEHMPSGIDTLSIVVEDKEIEGKLEKVVAEIHQECGVDSITVYPEMALIATVGRGMANPPGTAAQLFTALAEASVNIRMIDQGSSEMNIIVGVETGDFERAVKAIYNAFA